MREGTRGSLGMLHRTSVGVWAIGLIRVWAWAIVHCVAQASRAAPRLRLVSTASAADAGQVDRWSLHRQGRAQRHPCLALAERSKVKLVGPHFTLQVRETSKICTSTAIVSMIDINASVMVGMTA
jgi:hypothetical protein